MEVTPESKLGKKVLKVATDLAVSECISKHREEILTRVKELLQNPEKLIEQADGTKSE